MKNIKKLVLIGLVLYVLASVVAALISNSEVVIKAISLVGVLIHYSVGIIFPFAYVVVTGNYLKGVWYYWSIGCLSLLFFSIAFPAILMGVKPESSDTIARFFPETIGLVPMVLLGWIVGFLGCGIAYGLRVVFLYFKHKRVDK